MWGTAAALRFRVTGVVLIQPAAPIRAVQTVTITGAAALPVVTRLVLAVVVAAAAEVATANGAWGKQEPRWLE